MSHCISLNNQLIRKVTKENKLDTTASSDVVPPNASDVADVVPKNASPFAMKHLLCTNVLNEGANRMYNV